jgi:Bacterial regulatory helix-turn-helix protein, lysR family
MKPFCYHSFDLRQLVSFAEIARAGSFRQAAKTFHIAQPALSRQIKQLEGHSGFACSIGLRVVCTSRSKEENWPAGCLFSFPRSSI